MPRVNVIKPGFQTTVQDLGRPHYAHYGVSASGAADAVSFRIGNLLVGNDENTPALEMTLVGGEFEFDSSAVIAVTGSNFKPLLDGEPLPPWTTVAVRAGQVLKVQVTTKGARCYLAIRGGLVVPRVLGSASTHVLTGIGGLGGRPLKQSDVLEYLAMPEAQFQLRKFNVESLAHSFEGGTLRVTRGPQIEFYNDDTLKLFTESVYSVSEDTNRMGIRLQGPPLTKKEEREIITEGVSLGAVQISHDGMPIVLFVEHQTTGGYPKIANVITADLHRLGQLRPRDAVRFEFVSLETAESLLEELESLITQHALIGT